METVAESRGAALVEEDSRAQGDRWLATSLFVLIGLITLIQVVAGEPIPPLVVTSLIYAGLAFVLLRRRSRSLLIAAAVTPALHLVTSIPFFAASLPHPESPASFLPEAAVALAAGVVIAGAVAALRGAPPAERKPIPMVAGAIMAIAAVVSMVAAAGLESDARAAGDVEVAAEEAAFPDQVTVAAGSAALWVDNRDRFRHTFVVEGTDTHIELPGSTAVRIETDLSPGTYRYFCDVPGHESMEGKLIVQ